VISKSENHSHSHRKQTHDFISSSRLLKSQSPAPSLQSHQTFFDLPSSIISKSDNFAVSGNCNHFISFLQKVFRRLNRPIHHADFLPRLYTHSLSSLRGRTSPQIRANCRERLISSLQKILQVLSRAIPAALIRHRFLRTHTRNFEFGERLQFRRAVGISLFHHFARSSAHIDLSSVRRRGPFFVAPPNCVACPISELRSFRPTQAIASPLCFLSMAALPLSFEIGLAIQEQFSRSPVMSFSRRAR
jgi:hypothetical protein